VLDAEHVYITGGSDVFASADAGASWHSLHADAPLHLSAVQFPDARTPPGQITYVDARTVWVLGDQLERSDDGGQTWTEENLGLIHPTGVQFVNRSDGWLTLAQSGTFLVTHDGGRTWQQIWPQLTQRPSPAGPQR